jgi:UDP-N-acetylmuramate dehydrogenase
LQAALPGRVSLDEPLARHCSFKIGGPADCLARPADEAELQACLAFAKARALPVFLLAGGTNLLVRDGGIRGLTLKLEGAFRDLSIDGDKVKAGAGMNLALLSKKTALAGLAGIECLVGVPGTLGGGLVMNAGAHGQELKDVVTGVGVLEAGELRTLSNADCGFEYRHSRFKGSATLLLWAELQLSRAEPAALQARMDEALAKRRASQPLELPNAGCVFKNPAGASAGRLIDECGLKGRRVGGAEISALHANFVVNTGGARAADVLALMDEARRVVLEKRGVRLEDEVLVVGEDA